MADILIRGMEMPRDCSVCELSQKRVFASSIMCPITRQTVGYYDQGYHQEKHDCPLLPIPEGHGRLIDADALKKRTPMVIDYSAGGFGTTGAIHAVRGYGDWQIDQAPTIVPAEGGNADDSQL